MSGTGIHGHLMKHPMFYVDFNEMLENDLVLFSKTDEKRDADDNVFFVHAGMAVDLFMDDLDDQGRPDPLLARGTLEINDSDASWGRNVKWCCRIDADGIRHRSDIEA